MTPDFTKIDPPSSSEDGLNPITLDIPTISDLEKQRKETPLEPDDNLTESRKIAISTCLILCNSLLVRLLSDRR